MKVLTKELSGPALNWAVAKAKGWKDYPEDCVEAGRFWHTQPERAPFDPVIPKETWQPAYKWEHGGPIIERAGVYLRAIRKESHELSGTWLAQPSDGNTGTMVRWVKREDWPGHYFEGPTPLIAAMRCYVASELGDEIDVPEELL